MANIKIGEKTFIVPGPGSPCDLWKAYYQQLRREVGQQNAKTLWLITWEQNGSPSCTTGTEFNQWLAKRDIDVSNASTRALADLGSIGGNILGLGKNLTKAVAIGAPVVLGAVTLVIGTMLVNIARKTEVSDLAAMHPAGRAISGLKLLGR